MEKIAPKKAQKNTHVKEHGLSHPLLYYFTYSKDSLNEP
jgi:hypothetical protein